MIFYNFQKNASLETLRFKISMKSSPQVSLKDIFFDSVLPKALAFEINERCGETKPKLFLWNSTIKNGGKNGADIDKESHIKQMPPSLSETHENMHDVMYV